jgi:hypothetical protein
MILPIFGVEPPLKATAGRIRVIWGAGGQPIAWEGPLSMGESGISQVRIPPIVTAQSGPKVTGWSGAS